MDRTEESERRLNNVSTLRERRVAERRWRLTREDRRDRRRPTE